MWRFQLDHSWPTATKTEAGGTEQGSNKMLGFVSAWRHRQPERPHSLIDTWAITQQVNGIIVLIGTGIIPNSISVSSVSSRLLAKGKQNQLECFALIY